MQQKPPTFVAAVDLGSNSFHMIVCSLENNKLQTVDRIKEMVRLGSGLNKKDLLDTETQERALACLQRFGQRLRDIPPASVQVVGTNTLRTAKNSRQFIAKAEKALGHPIHIIAGTEEARLIYQGVAHSLQSEAKTRLVMDIGGGSTEYIIGTGYMAKRKESLNMGCVSMSKQFFKHGKISNKRFQKAVLHAEQLLEPFQRSFHYNHWQEAIGASGTLRSVDQVLQANEWSNNGITLDGLQKLNRYLLKNKHISDLTIDGLDPERREVFPGGLAIIYATFMSLGICQMSVSDGALREGLILDLVGRFDKQDVRANSIKVLTERYHTSTRHAGHLKKTLRMFLDQVQPVSGLDKNIAQQWLYWAADVHEIGHNIAHNQYHKHGAYIVEHTDLPGFSRQDQQLLATMILYHRRKLKKHDFYKPPPPWDQHSLYLTILLRLAVLLHRNRSDSDLPEFKLSITDHTIDLKFANGWLKNSPLTQADLSQETDYLKTVGMHLNFN